MRLIRRFEDEVQSLFQQGLVHGTTHLCSGQEAGPVGVCSVLGDEDRVAGTYRGHGHALALGVEPEALMAELLGRATGVCAGRAGSMNVIDLEHRLVGCFGIVGGSIAAATGVGARAQAPRRRGGRLLRRRRHQPGLLPRVPELRQGPRRSRSSTSARTTSTASSRRSSSVTAGRDPRARRGRSGMPTRHHRRQRRLDGERRARPRRCERARAGGGPQFVESLTYRYVGHSRSDPGKYRKPGELDEWKLRDPLLVARAGLAERYGTTRGGARRRRRRRSRRPIAAVVEAAKAAPFPDPEAPVTEFKRRPA